jgi:hypothetical protein
LDPERWIALVAVIVVLLTAYHGAMLKFMGLFVDSRVRKQQDSVSRKLDEIGKAVESINTVVKNGLQDRLESLEDSQGTLAEKQDRLIEYLLPARE